MGRTKIDESVYQSFWVTAVYQGVNYLPTISIMKIEISALYGDSYHDISLTTLYKHVHQSKIIFCPMDGQNI